MANDATIRVGADTRDAERALGGLQRSLQALAVGFVTKELVKLADASTNLQNKLRSVSGSTQEAAQAFQSVATIAMKTGTDISAVGDLYQKISLQSRALGLSQTEVARITENFSKALTITGTTGQAASSAIYQFAQSLGRGKVAYEDIRQLQEASSATVALIAKQFGMSGQEFVEAVQKGRISSQELALAVNSIGPEVDKTFKDMTKTIGQSLQNIQTSFVVMINNFEKSTGAFDKLARLLNLLATNMDTVVVAAGTFMAVFAAKKILDIAIAFRTLNTVMKANPIFLIASLGAAAVATLMEMADTEDDIAKATKEISKNEEKTRGIKDAVKDIGREQLKDLNDYLIKQQNGIDAIVFGTREELAIRDAIKNAADQLKISEDQVSEAVRTRVTQLAIETENRKSAVTYAQTMTDLMEQASVLGIVDRKEAEIQSQLMAYRKTVTERIYNLTKDTVEQQLRQNQALRETVELERQANDASRQRAFGPVVNDIKDLNTLVDNNASYNAILEKRLQVLDKINESTRTQATAQQDLTAEVERQIQQNRALAMVISSSGMDELEKEIAIGRIQQKNADLRTSLQYQLHDLRMRQEEEYQSQVQKTFEMYYKEMGYNTKDSKQMAQERADFEKKTEQEKAQWAIQQAGSVFTELGKYNRQAFEASKALNIANAIMNTYTGVTKALATYPPPFNFIAAGATLAFGLAQIATIRSQQYSGRAIGGSVIKDRSYIVGENGPEMFTPTGSGRITPNNQLGGGTTNINFTIQAVDSRGVDQLLQERRPMIVSMIRSAMADRGVKPIV